MARDYYTYRPRQPRYFTRRRRPPYLAYAILILFLILFIYFISNRLENIAKTKLENYQKQIEVVIKGRSYLSRRFNSLWKNLEKTSRPEVETQLNLLIKESSALEKHCRKVKPPEELKFIHSFLQFSLKIGAQGFKNFKPALFNGLKDVDPEVASLQLLNCFRDFALSDTLLSIYLKETKKKFSSRKVSFYLSDAPLISVALVDRSLILNRLNKIRSARPLQEVHGVAIISLATKPRPLRKIYHRNLYILPATELIAVTVEIVNQGNVDETEVKVKASLKSERQANPRNYQIVLPILKKGERKAVTFENLLVDNEPEVVNLLTINVVPVPGEKYAGNNTREFKFKLE